MAAMSTIWFCGDTHGSLEHIVEYVLVAHAGGQAPAAVILLGDIDAPRPLHLEFDAIHGLTGIYWIPGNHDSDDNTAWTNLVLQPACRFQSGSPGRRNCFLAYRRSRRDF